MTTYTWGAYEQNVLKIQKDTELLSFAYKINDGPTKVVSRRLFSEKELVKMLWKLVDEADVIVAQNGDSFDIKMANMYFLKYKLSPPSPYKTVDTKKVAKKYFRFPQNKLDYIAQFLFQDKKHETNMQLWFDCMAGNKGALLTMERYNKQDVDLLYRVYMTLRPWMTNHPNTNIYLGSTHKCPNCGGNTQKRGHMVTRVGKYQRYACIKCGAWSRGEKIKHDKVIS